MRIVDIAKIVVGAVSSFTLGWFSHSLYLKMRNPPPVHRLQGNIKRTLASHLTEPYFE